MLVCKCVPHEGQVKFNVSKYDVVVNPLAVSLVGPVVGSLVGPVAAKWGEKWYLGKWYWKSKHSALLELVHTRLYLFGMRLHTSIYV